MNHRSRVGPRLLLADLLPPHRVRIPLEATTKAALIEELATFLAEVGGVPEAAGTIHDAVLERERVLSTGIGDGVAIPHGKSAAVGKLVLVAGRTRVPVDFEALDSHPVRLALMLVGPESAAGLHVKVLSRISRLLRDRGLRERLVAARTPEEFVAGIRDAESR